MKKKVFFVMSTDDFSGAEAVNFAIIEGLKRVYDFYWVSKKGNINKFLNDNKIKWIEIKELNVKEIKRIVKENNPDILHATDFRSSVICALSNTKVPYISHLHNNSPWLKKICINSLVYLYAGLKANKILTVSSSIEKEYIFSKIIKEKLENIGNPVSRKKILSKINKDSSVKEYDICTVARLTEQKNPQKFVRIIAELKKEIPNIKTVWVGSGHLLEETQKLCKELNVQDNIDFVGFQNNPYQYMNKSKIFMLTSDWEGYGLVAFEALTLGLPSVVSNVGGLVDIIDDTCGKLCTRKEEYIDFIIDILKDNKKLLDYSNGATKRSRKLDNIDIYLKKITKIYENVSK